MFNHLKTFIALVILSGLPDSDNPLAAACMPKAPCPAPTGTLDEVPAKDGNQSSDTKDKRDNFTVLNREQLSGRIDLLLDNQAKFWQNFLALYKETDPSKNDLQVMLRGLAREHAGDLWPYVAQSLIQEPRWRDLIRADQIPNLEQAAAQLNSTPDYRPSKPLIELIKVALAPDNSQGHFQYRSILGLMSQDQVSELLARLSKLGVELNAEQLRAGNFTEEQRAHLLLLLAQEDQYLPEVKQGLPLGAYPQLDLAYGLRDRRGLPPELKALVDSITRKYSEPFDSDIFEARRPKFATRIPPVTNLGDAIQALESPTIAPGPKDGPEFISVRQVLLGENPELLQRYLKDYGATAAEQRAANAVKGFESGAITRIQLVVELLVSSQLTPNNDKANSFVNLAREHATHLEKRVIEWWQQTQSASEADKAAALPPLEFWLLAGYILPDSENDSPITSENEPLITFLLFTSADTSKIPRFSDNSGPESPSWFFTITDGGDLKPLLKQPGVINHQAVSMQSLIAQFLNGELAPHQARKALQILFKSGDAPDERYRQEIYDTYSNLPKLNTSPSNERARLIRLLLEAGLEPDGRVADEIAALICEDIQKDGLIASETLGLVTTIVNNDGAEFLAPVVGPVIKTYINAGLPVERPLIKALTKTANPEMIKALIAALPKEQRLELANCIIESKIPYGDERTLALLMIILNDCLTNPALKDEALRTLNNFSLEDALYGIMQIPVIIPEITDLGINIGPGVAFHNLVQRVLNQINSAIQEGNSDGYERPFISLIEILVQYRGQNDFKLIRDDVLSLVNNIAKTISLRKIDETPKELIASLAHIVQFIDPSAEELKTFLTPLKPNWRLTLIRELAMSAPTWQVQRISEALSAILEAYKENGGGDLAMRASTDAILAGRIISLGELLLKEPKGEEILNQALEAWFKRFETDYKDDEAALKATWFGVVDPFSNFIVLGDKLVLSPEQIEKLHRIINTIRERCNTDDPFIGVVSDWLENKLQKNN